jgi:hypothetical protein
MALFLPTGQNKEIKYQFFMALHLIKLYARSLYFNDVAFFRCMILINEKQENLNISIAV